MSLSPADIERDYNRGLPRPVRAARLALAAVWGLVGPLVEWALAPCRRGWAVPISLGVAATVILLPWDEPISTALRRFEIKGDLERELGAWQQFGALGSLVFVASAVWLLDPARRRRLLDLIAAATVAWFAVAILKVAIGRPRPREIYGDPATFLGPWGQYPVEVEPGRMQLLYAWDPAVAASADLWSMPSSHTAAAAALAVFLVALYPRIRPLAAALVAVVAVCRLLFGAHWPTDVVMGAAVGVAAGQVAVSRYWGVRALDWFWIRIIDRRAQPALARTLAIEHARGGLGAGLMAEPSGWAWWYRRLAATKQPAARELRASSEAFGAAPMDRAVQPRPVPEDQGSGPLQAGEALNPVPGRDRRPEGV